MRKAIVLTLVVLSFFMMISCKTSENAAAEEPKPKSNLEVLMAMNLGTRQAGDNSIRTTNWFESQARKKAEASPAEENQGKVIFYGASNIDYWTTLQDDFPEYNVLNFAIAGTTIEEEFSYSEFLIYPYNPKVLVLSGSTNDYVAYGSELSDEDLLERAFNARVNMIEDYKALFPGCAVVVLDTRTVPAREEFTPLTIKLNEMTEDYCESHEGCFYSGAQDIFYNADGSYRMELFIEDGIHLTAEARSLWAEVIRPVIAQAVDSLEDKGNVLHQN